MSDAETRKPRVAPLTESSGIRFGPFNVRLCNPVTEKISGLEMCGPNVEIRLRDPNELLRNWFADLLETCDPASCGPEQDCKPTGDCKPVGTGLWTCGPTVWPMRDLVESVVNPIREAQRELDRKIDTVMSNIKELERRIRS